MLRSLLQSSLRKREQENLFRKLTHSTRLIDFVSNDYLGLARSDELFKIIQEKAASLPHANGATGSRLLSGNSPYTQYVEQRLAKIFNAEGALIFNSGYTANLAVLSSLPRKGDRVIYDELAHACIKDGARLSFADKFSFKHNDLNDLEKKIQKSKGKIFVVVESIYSMDGDQAPLKELVKLCEQYNAILVLDEAHSTGAYGPEGSGLATQMGIEQNIPIRIYTFGKAMGIHGACVVGERTLIEYLINFARPFIYTTALPPHSIAAIDCSFDFLKDNIHLQAELNKRINLLMSLSQPIANRIASESAIQSIIFPGNHNARNAAVHLQDSGLDVRPILSPTVRPGTERLRICLHTFNTDDEIKNLVDHLTAIGISEN